MLCLSEVKNEITFYGFSFVALISNLNFKIKSLFMIEITETLGFTSL